MVPKGCWKAVERIHAKRSRLAYSKGSINVSFFRLFCCYYPRFWLMSFRLILSGQLSCTLFAFFYSPTKCLGAACLAIHGGHNIVKHFVMSFFCTHHHKSSQQLRVREQALGALPRLHLCPPCSLWCGPLRPFGPAHCLHGRILKTCGLEGLWQYPLASVHEIPILRVP